MYAIAIIGDLLSVIPIVNWITIPVMIFALGIAGRETGVHLWTPKGAGATLACCGLEAVLGFLPAWTVRVYWAKKEQQSQAG